MSIDDLNLLRQYEPVVRFTTGELFFPCAIETYLNDCSLWQTAPEGKQTLLAERGTLTPEKLASFHDIPPEHNLYLRFVEDPMDGLEYQKWRREQPPFHSRGRLTRVGLASRIIDSGFDLSLLIRGKVPGGTTAAAHEQYRQMRRNDSRYVYYGRVVREGGYIVLHYLYFYVMNNWRSTFYGVNDHEADWEQVFIYLSDEGKKDPLPLWLAYAAHNESGDDLRRRWDDPSLTFVDTTHPVIYAGAGSHASYFIAGDYLTRFRLQILEPMRNTVQILRRFWTDTLRQGDSYEDEQLREQVDDFFGIPFLDYARGDGIAIGTKQVEQWSAILIDDSIGWVNNYRGLWGLDTQDPLGGERAPAGPKYNRDGTIRQSWHNPLGWSGLHKVSPPNSVIKQLRQHITMLKQEEETLDATINEKRKLLRLADLEFRALLATDYLNELTNEHRETLHKQAEEVNDLYDKQAALQDTILATSQYLQKLEDGTWQDDPRAHITHLHKPERPQQQFTRAMEFWAALSSGLLFLMLALSLVITPGYWIMRVLVILGIFIVIESFLRGQIARFLLNTVLFLAVITLIVLVIEFLPLVLLVILLLLARLLILENLREFTGGIND